MVYKCGTKRWIKAFVTNKELITKPEQSMEGVLLTINQIRMGHGKCGSLLNKRHYKESTTCDCGEREQTMMHIVTKRLIKQGTKGLH